jgi:hypothetical protein
MDPKQDEFNELKIKRKPKQKQIHIVNIAPGIEKDDIENKKQVTIRDKTGIDDINREDFIKKLKGIGSIVENKKQIIQEEQKETKEDTIKKTVAKKKKKALIKLSTKQEKNNEGNIESTIDDNKEEKVEALKETPKFPTIDTTNPIIQPLLTTDIDGVTLEDRLPQETKPVIIKRDRYILNNRKAFVNFINEIFQPYRKEIKNEETGKNQKDKDVELFTHQKIVRDYINLYTPYRGLLLYHGLGSGKTCTSIGIAEGIIKTAAVAMGESIGTNRKIFVLMPASLRTNYFEELKKCGNPIYRKNQHWEFIDTVKQPEHIDTLSKVLHLPVSVIETQKGAWMVDVTKKPNYDTLDAKQQKSLEYQLNEMIVSKFIFYNYNNPNLKKDMNTTMTNNHTKNPFDNKVVIIDEAHNLIGRIVNKMGPSYNGYKKEELPVAINMYRYLMNDENCRIILLSGTPIINYPNEIGVIYNILRGCIITYKFTLSAEGGGKISSDKLRKALDSDKSIDYMELRNNNLYITRNPFGFVNTPGLVTYKGVMKKEHDEQLPLSNVKYMNSIIKNLSKANIKVDKKEIERSKALPDKIDEFISEFINSTEGDIKNQYLFKKRIIGLTSFLNDKEELMPKYEEDDPNYFTKVYIPMSSYMFPLYHEIRKEERSREKKGPEKKKPDADQANILFKKASSSYRVASRAMCNFAFPEEIPRPKIIKVSSTGKNDKELTEEDIDGIIKKYDEKNKKQEEEDTRDDIPEEKEDSKKKYIEDLKKTLTMMDEKKATYLTEPKLSELSPKFSHMLGNITNPDNKGLHMVYSQFRTLEGIGIFALTMEANGYRRFKLKKDSKNNFAIDIPDDHEPGKLYALYTGTETTEEKETIRKIYNSEWSQLPIGLVDQLKDIHTNNHYGEIIKVLMITQSGAEGINLKNTRFVHIMEPYWHPVRTKQVIGRARRIRSHDDLPKEMRNVKVFMYIMEFTEEQHKTMPIDLKNNDRSKFDKSNIRALTTDQSLYEISNRKENINRKLTRAIKESSVDCSLYDHSNEKDPIECHSFGLNLKSTDYAFVPDIKDEDKTENIDKANQPNIELSLRRTKFDGIDYAERVTKSGKRTYYLYTYDSYLEYKKNPTKSLVYVGKIRVVNGKPVIDTRKKDDFKDI